MSAATAAAAAQDAASGPGRVPAEEVRAALDDVLASSEFLDVETALDRWIAALRRFLAELLPAGALDGPIAEAIATGIVWTLLGGAAAMVIWVALRAWLGRSRRVARAADEPPAESREQRVARLCAAAREADERGEHVLAMRLAFTALVCALGERGDLEYRDAYTNRELLERGRPGREAESLLRPLVPDLDARSFGGTPATRADYQRIARLVARYAPEVAA